MDELRTPGKIKEYEETIKHPGKFEGCPSYVPYYYEIGRNGLGNGFDAGDAPVERFKVTPGDRKAFPELKRRKVVRLWYRDDGFVIEL